MYIYCFECGPKRSKQNTKTLFISNYGRYCLLRCYHPGCLYNEGTYMRTTRIKEVIGTIPAIDNKEVQFLIPIDETIIRPSLNEDEIDYDYRDIEGNLLFIVRRFPNKEFLPISMNTDKQWICKRPHIKALYNAEALDFLWREDPLLIVEGEKCADYVWDHIPITVFTWPGGAKNVDQGDWQLIKNRRVFLWPDNDDPGILAMIEVMKYLERDNVVKMIPTADFPAKADAADFTPTEIREILGQANVFN